MGKPQGCPVGSPSLTSEHVQVARHDRLWLNKQRQMNNMWRLGRREGGRGGGRGGQTDSKRKDGLA